VALQAIGVGSRTTSTPPRSNAVRNSIVYNGSRSSRADVKQSSRVCITVGRCGVSPPYLCGGGRPCA